MTYPDNPAITVTEVAPGEKVMVVHPIQDLFDGAMRDRELGDVCQNPGTGGYFVVGDPTDEQMDQASIVQHAMKKYEMDKPVGFPPLPVGQREWSEREYNSAEDWLAVQFARSLSANDYFLGHPGIYAYASGFRARWSELGPNVPGFIRDKVHEELDRIPLNTPPARINDQRVCVGNTLDGWIVRKDLLHH
jgi:hypothetical protein